MRYFPAALERLTEQFARLPGIGGKTAQRLALEYVQEFAAAHPIPIWMGGHSKGGNLAVYAAAWRFTIRTAPDFPKS